MSGCCTKTSFHQLSDIKMKNKEGYVRMTGGIACAPTHPKNKQVEEENKLYTHICA